MDFLFFPCSEYENFLVFTSIGTQVWNSSRRESDFLLSLDFSLSNWAYIVFPSLAEVVAVRMCMYFTVPS